MRQTLTGVVNVERVVMELDTADSLEVSQAIDMLIRVFRNHWEQSPGFWWGARVEWVLSNAIRILLVTQGATLADLSRLLSDQAFREPYKHTVTNPLVHEFWAWYETVESTHRPQGNRQLIQSVITRVNQLRAVSQ